MKHSAAAGSNAFGESICAKMNADVPPCPQVTVWLSGLRGQGFTSDGHRLSSLYRVIRLPKMR